MSKQMKIYCIVGKLAINLLGFVAFIGIWLFIFYCAFFG